MSVLIRSVGSAFRNKVRTTAVVTVLAVAIGLALAMLVANQAVAAKVQELNSTVGTVLTVNAAGSQGFEGGGEPLTSEQARTAATVTHVTDVVGISSLRLRNAADVAAQANQRSGPGGGTAASVTTSLTSSVEAGTLGNRNQSEEAGSAASAQPMGSLPINATGVGAEIDASGSTLDITEGTGLGDYGVESSTALLGSTLAEKNGLTVGSTFTIKEQTFTVAGLFDAGTTFGNNAVYLTLPTAQAIAELPDELSVMYVTVDTMENIATAKTALQEALGTENADVIQGEANIEAAVDSLGSVRNISMLAFVAALATAGLIILLIMVMLVRERRREIGVLKAIGAPNRTVGLQFVLEALVLVAMGSVVGAAIASFTSSGIASALISSNTSTTGSGSAGTRAMRMPAGGGGFTGGDTSPFGGAGQLLTSVSASASPTVIAAGVAAVFGVAVIGALVPALLTARIRPIEVLRGE